MAIESLCDETKNKLRFEQKINKSPFKAVIDVINFVYEAVNPMYAASKFFKTTRINQTPTDFLLELSAIAKCAFRNESKVDRERKIAAQYITGINDENLMRKMVSAKTEKLSELFEVTKEEMELRQILDETRNYTVNLNSTNNEEMQNP
ncbi:hypothetical protein SNEBB_005754 [Seison nebaliae]|nr:hypothetical protein SNEBB_005754 [Seison nebaliae]